MLLNLIIDVDALLLNNFIFIDILKNVKESIKNINVTYLLLHFLEILLFFSTRTSTNNIFFLVFSLRQAQFSFFINLFLNSSS